MQIEALKEFIMEQGASKNNNLQQWDKIWAINKQARFHTRALTIYVRVT